MSSCSSCSSAAQQPISSKSDSWHACHCTGNRLVVATVCWKRYIKLPLLTVLFGPATPTTYSPWALAICTARWPTPPEAVKIRTRWPRTGAPCTSTKQLAPQQPRRATDRAAVPPQHSRLPVSSAPASWENALNSLMVLNKANSNERCCDNDSRLGGDAAGLLTREGDLLHLPPPMLALLSVLPGAALLHSPGAPTQAAGPRPSPPLRRTGHRCRREKSSSLQMRMNAACLTARSC